MLHLSYFMSYLTHMHHLYISNKYLYVVELFRRREIIRINCAHYQVLAALSMSKIIHQIHEFNNGSHISRWHLDIGVNEGLLTYLHH